MVSKDDFLNALQQLKATSPKRKFAQSIDLILNLKELDLKKPEEQLDVWVPLVHPKGKPVRTAALVGPELQEQAKAACDTVITHDEFKKYEGKKKDIRNLAKKHDLFIAQANIMPDIARYFGRILGPRGKMPNPKAGCVVPPNANLKALTDKLKKALHVVAKTQLSAKCSVGKENMPDDQLLENIMTVYNAVIHALPQETNNIKSVLLKYSMGPPLKVGATVEEKATKKAAKAPARAEASASRQQLLATNLRTNESSSGQPTKSVLPAEQKAEKPAEPNVTKKSAKPKARTEGESQ